MPYVYLVIAILFETIGTTALKASEGFTKLWPSVIVVIGYSVSFWFLAQTLKTIPVGIAYAFWSALGIAFITFIGWVIFGQKLDGPAIVGLGLIISGVVVISLFSNSTSH